MSFPQDENGRKKRYKFPESMPTESNAEIRVWFLLKNLIFGPSYRLNRNSGLIEVLRPSYQS